MSLLCRDLRPLDVRKQRLRPAWSRTQAPAVSCCCLYALEFVVFLVFVGLVVFALKHIFQ